MRAKQAAVSVLVALAAGSLLTAQPAARQPVAAEGAALLVAAQDLRWVDVPDTPVKMATVKGDSQKGAHAAFIKLPAGFSAPLHSHTADHHVVVVTGSLTLVPEGGTARQLGPGSWFEFTGKKKHTTACGAGGDCLLFIVASGAWDLVPADAPKK